MITSGIKWNWIGNFELVLMTIRYDWSIMRLIKIKSYYWCWTSSTLKSTIELQINKWWKLDDVLAELGCY